MDRQTAVRTTPIQRPRFARTAAGAAACVALVAALAGCSGGAPDAIAESGAPVAETVPPPPLPSIAEWVADAEWSWADQGVQVPTPVVFSAGKATDEVGNAYELLASVPGDADGDGVEDAAVLARQTSGHAVTDLWYVWMGVPGATADGAIAQQVVYPIGRSTGCGDVVNSVTPISGGFRIDQSLRLPFIDDALPCSSPGTGAQVREVTVQAIDGTWYPVQTAPVAAWGGICPRSDWLDGVEDVGITARAAPPASAPGVSDPNLPIVSFQLPESPLMTQSGAKFAGFIQVETTEVVRQQCAFF